MYMHVKQSAQNLENFQLFCDEINIKKCLSAVLYEEFTTPDGFAYFLSIDGLPIGEDELLSATLRLNAEW